MTYAELREKHLSKHIEYYRNPISSAVEPFRLFGPIWYVGDRQVCIHLIDTGDGLLMIDSGFPQAEDLLRSSIVDAGFKLHEVRWILHTHGHFDHFGASEGFREDYGTKLLISRTDALVLKEHPEISLLDFCGTTAPGFRVPEFDIYIDDEEELSFGLIKVLCKQIPGHTPGALALFIEIERAGEYFRAGLFGGSGKGSLSCAALDHFGEPLSLRQDMLESLEKVKNERVDVFLGNHPGNNDTFSCRSRQVAGDPDAFLNRGAWRTFIERTSDEMRVFFAEDNRI